MRDRPALDAAEARATASSSRSSLVEAKLAGGGRDREIAVALRDLGERMACVGGAARPFQRGHDLVRPALRGERAEEELARRARGARAGATAARRCRRKRRGRAGSRRSDRHARPSRRACRGCASGNARPTAAPARSKRHLAGDDVGAQRIAPGRRRRRDHDPMSREIDLSSACMREMSITARGRTMRRFSIGPSVMPPASTRPLRAARRAARRRPPRCPAGSSRTRPASRLASFSRAPAQPRQPASPVPCSAAAQSAAPARGKNCAMSRRVTLPSMRWPTAATLPPTSAS